MARKGLTVGIVALIASLLATVIALLSWFGVEPPLVSHEMWVFIAVLSLACIVAVIVGGLEICVERMKDRDDGPILYHH